MNLLADEGIDRQIVAALREKGYLVGYVATSEWAALALSLCSAQETVVKSAYVMFAN